MSCVCPEARYLAPSRRCASRKGAPVPQVVEGHDCAYVRARNALIPRAARMAYGMAVDERDPVWSLAFLNAMTMLAKEHLGSTA